LTSLKIIITTVKDWNRGLLEFLAKKGCVKARHPHDLMKVGCVLVEFGINSEGIEAFDIVGPTYLPGFLQTCCGLTESYPALVFTSF
jgi:hypothetical protein